MKTTERRINEFERDLWKKGMSESTARRYADDVRRYVEYSGGRVDMESAEEYRSELCRDHTASSVNTTLSSLNAFFGYVGAGIKMKYMKLQRMIFSSDEKELSKSEYERLLAAAKRKGNERLYMLMQTICSTGIRVSEVKAITVESLSREYADVYNKGKQRRVYYPKALCRMLRSYCRERKITSGPVFVTRNGNPIDRSNIWSDMKALCKSANVSEKKVFPHNLRHLFARTYYNLQKDIVRLADILGHSSIDTTRIYTMESGAVHQRQIQRLGLLFEK